MMAERQAEWIALDWRAERLRLWAMRGDQAQATAGAEVGSAAPERAAALTAALAEVSASPDAPILACGALWAEDGSAPALERVPCVPPVALPLANVHIGGRNVRLVRGLSQATPPDVMQGAETRIAGFLALNPGWDGVICLAGAEVHWAQISAGEVVSFQTFLTGALASQIAGMPGLAAALAADGWDDEAFADALADSLSKPERLAARLAGLRAADIVEGHDPARTRARLSGHLIGAELAAARPYWLGQNLALLGSASDTAPYAKALETQGAPVTLVEDGRMALQGLIAAWRAWQGAG